MLTDWASGSITNDQRSSSLCGTALRLIARLARVAVYSLGKRSCSSRERAHLKDAELPLHEGDARRRWKLAMIEAAPSPAFARRHSAMVRDSSLRYREGGDTPWC
jgi:hypothetical protein